MCFLNQICFCGHFMIRDIDSFSIFSRLKKIGRAWYYKKVRSLLVKQLVLFNLVIFKVYDLLEMIVIKFESL